MPGNTTLNSTTGGAHGDFAQVERLPSIISKQSLAASGQCGLAATTCDSFPAPAAPFWGCKVVQGARPRLEDTYSVHIDLVSVQRKEFSLGDEREPGLRRLAPCSTSTSCDVACEVSFTPLKPLHQTLGAMRAHAGNGGA